jgi:hypothetical protein
MPEKNTTSADLVERIKQDMQRSGFPLEFHVLNVCSTKNTGRMPGLRYEFLKQPRELDLLASFEEIALNRKEDANLQHTRTELIIECKKRADKPWVFMSSPWYSFTDVLYHLNYSSEYDVYFAKKELPPLLDQIARKLKGTHYTDSLIPKCISYYEAFKDPNQPSDIYKAIDNVVSYILWERGRRLESLQEFGTFSEFYFPIVVLDGKLFEATITHDKIEVNERPHIQLRTFHQDGIFIIDFVTREHFEKVFSTIEHFHRKVVSAIRSLHLPSEFRRAAWARHKAQFE